MLLMSFFCLLHSSAGCRDRAEVASIQGDRPLYREERIRYPCHGRRARDSVRYLRPDGSVLGSKIIGWRPDQLRPDFELRMDSPLERVSVKWRGDTARIELERQNVSRTYDVQVPPGTVVDAGIDVWIVENLPRLATGGSLDVPLLVPEFHRVIWFSAKATANEAGRPNRVLIELKPRNWLLGALTTPLVAGYDAQTGSLTDFTGVSDLKDREGRNFKVRMRYGGWRSID